jgi:hypothetical protein
MGRSIRWHGTSSFVAFGDMLGFAQLVLDQPDTDEVRLARAVLDWHRRGKSKVAGGRPLEDRFVRFHNILNGLLDELRFNQRLTSVVFSDSFFVVADDGDSILALCAQMMRVMLMNDVPMRIGVAYGSFCLLESRQSTDPTRRFHTVQFLGKGVVNAHRAESKGLKGMRVGLHQSVIERDPTLLPDVAIELPEEQWYADCRHELNYIHPQLMPIDPSTQDLIAKVNEMRSKPENLGSIEHYDSTVQAVARMVGADVDNLNLRKRRRR